jgi:hypothetical protein
LSSISQYFSSTNMKGVTTPILGRHKHINGTDCRDLRQGVTQAISFKSWRGSKFS